MLFSNCIPDKLQEYLTVMNFMRLLDSLQEVKTSIIADSLRVDNAALLMDKKWLLKKLDEFGFSDFPIEYPIQIMQQFLLNVDTICRTRGSKIGIQLYCSVLSLGEVSVLDSNFYVRPSLIILNSIKQGYILADSKDEKFYICDDNSLMNPKQNLSIIIQSKFFNGDFPKEESIIKEYLQSTLRNQLGFSPDLQIHFNFKPKSDFYYHKLLNPYFV